MKAKIMPNSNKNCSSSRMSASSSSDSEYSSLSPKKFKNKWIFDVRVRGILCGAVFEVTGTRSLKGER